jgi:uncharacterized lipoprotein YmbA
MGLLIRAERYGRHRAATADEQLWAARLADRLDAALREAMNSPEARASLAAAERHATVSRKGSARTDVSSEEARVG